MENTKVSEIFPGIYIVDYFINPPSHIFSRSPILGTAIAFNKNLALKKARSEAFERYAFFDQPNGSIRYMNATNDSGQISLEENIFYCKGFNANQEACWIPLSKVYPFSSKKIYGFLNTSKGFACHPEFKKALENSLAECFEYEAVKEIWHNKNYFIIGHEQASQLHEKLRFFLESRQVVVVGHQDIYGFHTTCIYDFHDRGVIVASAANRQPIRSFRSAILELMLLCSNYNNPKFQVTGYLCKNKREALKENLIVCAKSRSDPRASSEKAVIPNYLYIDRTNKYIKQNYLYVVQSILAKEGQCSAQDRDIINYLRDDLYEYPFH